MASDFGSFINHRLKPRLMRILIRLHVYNNSTIAFPCPREGVLPQSIVTTAIIWTMSQMYEVEVKKKT